MTQVTRIPTTTELATEVATAKHLYDAMFERLVLLNNGLFENIKVAEENLRKHIACKQSLSYACMNPGRDILSYTPITQDDDV